VSEHTLAREILILPCAEPDVHTKINTTLYAFCSRVAVFLTEFIQLACSLPGVDRLAGHDIGDCVLQAHVEVISLA